MLNWKAGRQNTGYLNFKILESQLFQFDLYLLKFPEGSRVPPHKDEVEKGRHYRANLILWPAREGGKFLCEECIIDLPFFKLFRPDENTHAVTQILKGTRYVLSFGWVRS